MTSLPKFVVLKSKHNDKYMRFRFENGEVQGFLQFSGEDNLSPLAKIEVVKATSGEGLVHLRCTYNNKFLVRKSETQWWLVAGANNPEEDRSKWSCTLFKPVFVDGQPKTLRFLHVQLGHYAINWTSQGPYASLLFADSKTFDTQGRDVFTFLDWDSLLPPSDDKSIEVGPWGGPGGGAWSFEVKGGGITKIVICSNPEGLVSIAITGQTSDGKIVQSPTIGGQGGNPFEITLDWPREYVTSINGAYGIFDDNGLNIIKWMELTTNLGKKFGPFGNAYQFISGGAPFSFTMKHGAVVGFHGRGGSLIDAIGIYARPT